MSGEGFVDYYELLQVSPNADDDTIHRVFRHLAKKFHPDTPKTGNPELFNSLVEAYGALTDPARRAAYDARYKQYWDSKWKLAAEAADARGFINDEVLRERLLSLMYVQRRRSVQHPGMGEVELSRLVGTPLELLDFHIWYMREKGWVQRTDTGLFAITAAGVDQVEEGRFRLNPDHLIEERTSGSRTQDGRPIRKLTGPSPLLEDGLEY